MRPAPRSAPDRAAPDRAWGRRGAARHVALLALAAASGLALLALSGVLDPLIERLRSGAADEETGAAETSGAPDAAEPPPSVVSADEADGPATSARPGPTLEAPSPYDQNDAAVAKLEAGDLDGAIALLEQVVAARPDVDTFASNLSKAYVHRASDLRSKDPEAAIEDYDRALEWMRDDDRRARIESLRDRAKVIAETEKEFVVEPTLHFTFKFDGTRAELLDGIEGLKILLEDTYQEYGDLFRRRPVEAGEDRIEVVLYRANGFDAVTGLGDWAGGVFDGTIRVPVANLTNESRVQRIRTVLRHETAHAFSHSIGGPKVPAWLNEGVAQWLEDPARRASDVAYARGALARQDEGLFELSEITGGLTGWQDKRAIARAYEQALAFTDYLVQQYGSDLVFEMVAACKERGPDGAAEHFRSRILVDLDVVLDDFAATLQD